MYLYVFIKKKRLTPEILYLLLFFIYTTFIQSYKKNLKNVKPDLNTLKKKSIPEKVNSVMRLI